MKVLIVTPCLDQLEYLKRSVGSIADQNHEGEALQVFHHLQDGGSVGFDEWESNYRRVTGFRLGYLLSTLSQSDRGMYDAINLGVDQVEAEEGFSGNDKERVDIIAWLNCDEQYLPGALSKVSRFFECHPDVDLLFGGMLVVDDAGELLTCRKAMPMRRLFLEASYLYNYSCAMFFRRSLWDKLGRFDPSFKNAGDEELIRRALKLGAKTAVIDEYLSIFTYSGKNLSSDLAALEEHERLKRSAALTSRLFKLPLNLCRLTEKFLRGGLVQRGPIEYEIYVDDGPRKRFVCQHPVCSWPGHTKPYLLHHRLK